jgi:hypothetical protein
MDAVSEFEISKLHDGVRADGAPVLYILVKPQIDPEKTDYKRIIKGIITPLIPKLSKFSAHIYDDRQSLVLHYMYYTAQLGRELTKEELRLIARHCLAIYDRGLETGKNPSSLAFYPVDQIKDQKNPLFEEAEYNPEEEQG